MNRKVHGPAVLVALRMWQAGDTVETIGAAIGCTTSGVYSLSKRCGFPTRKRSTGGTLRMAEDDPTPLAIQAAALRIRIDHMEDKRRALA